MDSSNIVTLIFVVAAVFVFMQLRNVLGRRTGHERPPFDPASLKRERAETRDDEADNVITLPGMKDAKSDQFQEIDAVAKPGTPLNKGLRDIRAASPQFSPAEFVKGAGMAYEMIVMAFAEGDRKTLRSLLSKDVFDGFAAALDEREKNGEQVKTNFVGIDKIDITAAELRDTEAHVTVNVVSQLVSVTRDKAGAVVDGDPEAVVEVRDIWTFARDTRNRDPNWKLVATESDDQD